MCIYILYQYIYIYIISIYIYILDLVPGNYRNAYHSPTIHQQDYPHIPICYPIFINIFRWIISPCCSPLPLWIDGTFPCWHRKPPRLAGRSCRRRAWCDTQCHWWIDGTLDHQAARSGCPIGAWNDSGCSGWYQPGHLAIPRIAEICLELSWYRKNSWSTLKNAGVEVEYNNFVWEMHNPVPHNINMYVHICCNIYNILIYTVHTCDTRHPPSNTLGRLGLSDVIFWGKVSSTLEDHGTIALTNARGGNHWQGASGSVPWNSTAIGYSCSGVAVCKLQPFWSLQRCPSWRWIQTMTGSFSEDWNLGISH